MERKNRGIIGEIARKPKAFAVAFLAIFFVTYGFLVVMDATPEPVETEKARGSTVTTNTPAKVVEKELPVRITINKINVDASIANPSSTNLEVLDASLKNGASRYPTSAKLGEEGTVVLFGHSSYLPIVHNQTFKTFTGIQTLKKGETISVYSDTREYRYAVTGVELADASQDVVELAQRGKYLTLVTCDSFSKKTSRFIVTAELVGTYLLASN